MFGYNVMTLIQNITRKCKGDHWVSDEVSKNLLLVVVYKSAFLTWWVKLK